jgi:hypothetical protein
VNPMTYGEMKEEFDKLIADFPAINTLEETACVREILNRHRGVRAASNSGKTAGEVDR